MTGTELVVGSAASLAQLIEAKGAGKYATPAALAQVTSSYGSYIKLYGSNSVEVKRGEIPIGSFGLVRGKAVTLLGNEFVCMVVASRPKAMQYKPKMLAVYDVNSRDFSDIRSRADAGSNSNCGYGPEFLLWLPDQKEFALYFLGSKTGRNEAVNLVAVQSGKRVCIQKSELISNPEYSWHGPKTLPYDLDIALPSPEALEIELEKFNNPPVKEEVEEEASSRD